MIKFINKFKYIGPKKFPSIGFHSHKLRIVLKKLAQFSGASRNEVVGVLLDYIRPCVWRIEFFERDGTSLFSYVAKDLR